MSPQQATEIAKDILSRHPNEDRIKVICDNPADSRQSIKAFKTLGCRVKVEQDGNLLWVSSPQQK